MDIYFIAVINYKDVTVIFFMVQLLRYFHKKLRNIFILSAGGTLEWSCKHVHAKPLPHL